MFVFPLQYNNQFIWLVMKFCRVFQEKFAFNNIKRGICIAPKMSSIKDLRLSVESNPKNQITNQKVFDLYILHTINDKGPVIGTYHLKTFLVRNILPNCYLATRPVGIWILKWSLEQSKGKPNEIHFFGDRRGCLWIHIFIRFFVAILHNNLCDMWALKRKLAWVHSFSTVEKCF